MAEPPVPASVQQQFGLVKYLMKYEESSFTRGSAHVHTLLDIDADAFDVDADADFDEEDDDTNTDAIDVLSMSSSDDDIPALVER